MNTRDLVIYIVWYASQNSIRLSEIRLVKFIYLADLFQARKTKGKTITSLPWAFVYYGPYCSEVMKEIDEAVQTGRINKRSFFSRYRDSDEYHQYTYVRGDESHLEKSLHIEVLSFLKSAIKRYGDDTAALLDLIYFETEPMKNAKKGDILDFSLARPIELPSIHKDKKLSNEKIKIAKYHIENLAKIGQHEARELTTEEKKELKWKDELYFSALEYWDDGELEPGLEGQAEILD